MTGFTGINNAIQFWQQRCDGVAEIDVIVATMLCRDIPESICEQDRNVFFHLVLLLSALQRDGHTCLQLSEVASKTWLTSFDQDALAQKPGLTLPDLDRIHEVLDACLNDVIEPALRRVDDYLYVEKMFGFEQDIARLIHGRTVRSEHTLTEQQQKFCRKQWSLLFNEEIDLGVLHDNDTSPIDWQKRAILSALTQQTLIITGGPGTGKTYVAGRILMLLHAIQSSAVPLNMALVAPTGKAARRLSESLHQAMISESIELRLPHAQTIHSLLGLQPGYPKPRYHADNPLPHDLVLIDEASMLDAAMMARLLRAVKDGTRLIIIGDANQLPSVEAGNVLSAIVNQLRSSAPQCCVSLQKARRFNQSLSVIASACLVKVDDNRSSPLTELLENSEGVTWFKQGPQKGELIDAAREDFAPLLQANNEQDALRLLKTTRWLSPLRRTEYGAEGLNILIEQALMQYRNNQQRVVLQGQEFYPGKVVMVTQNSPATGCANGDVGVIWPRKDGTLAAWFENERAEPKAISLFQLPPVTSAFAMTVHKAQGSEFLKPRVVIPASHTLSAQASRLLDKALLYTGITRSREGFTLHCDATTLNAVLSQSHSRMSGLGYLLHQCFKGYLQYEV